MPVDVDLTVNPARPVAQLTVAAAASAQTSVGTVTLVQHVHVGDPTQALTAGAGHTDLTAGPGRKDRGE